MPQIGERLNVVYLEHGQINREDSAILVRDERGTTRIPAAAITVLLLGPGTTVTHRAIELIGDAGVGIVWVGEHGVRFYARGRPRTHRAQLLMKRAQWVSNQRTHLAVVRKMYQLRYPEEDVSGLTTQQLRGREGVRVRKAYRTAAKEWNLPWSGREFDPDNFSSGDPVNQALSAGHACLYGVAHAVIAALGCSPGLGFIHVGHERSFVYDIADLYKADLTIPIAFEMAAKKPDDLPSAVRRRIRDEMAARHLLEQIVRDIRFLLSDDDQPDDGKTDITYLWDSHKRLISNGRNYAEKGDMPE